MKRNPTQTYYILFSKQMFSILPIHIPSIISHQLDEPKFDSKEDARLLEVADLTLYEPEFENDLVIDN